MRLNSKGQVTIPAELRHKYGIEAGDEVQVVEACGVLHIVHTKGGQGSGKRLTRHMRGRATTAMTTDELMALLRGR